MELNQSTGTVVPFSGTRKDVRFPAISEVRAYWEALRNGRTIPLRSEIDPRGIERALEYAFVLERVAPKVARFRLAGMHLSDVMGMEVRGMPFTTYFSASNRDAAAEALEQVFAGPTIAEMKLTAESSLGKPPMEARLLIMPLLSDLGDVNRALGCFVADGAIGRAPRRFDLVDVDFTQIRLDQQPAPQRPAMTSGFAESQAPLVTPPLAERGHLRLVKTDS
jgi:hypothetical protein